jgi:hypothetical protein
MNNNKQNKSPIDVLIDKGYDDVIIFSEPSFHNALIGITDDYNAVYDYDLMIEWLMTHEDMDVEEAADFINFNDSFYYGEHYPVIFYGEDLEEELVAEDPEYEPLVFTRIEDLPNKYD